MVEEFDGVVDLINENQTRIQYIDPELEKAGWIRKYIKEEVNSVKSDFNQKQFVFFDGSVERGIDRFVDYVLLDEDNSVLAIIEAKRFSKDEEKGRIQARTYARDIESQIDRKVPIFLTNGYIWRFIDEDGIERKVSGPFSREDLRRRNDLYHKRQDLTFDDVEFMIREVSPLMKYYEPTRKKVIQVDAPDLVLGREKFTKKIKEDVELKEFLESNLLIQNIRGGKGITSGEIKQLEAQLSALRPELTIGNVRNFQKIDFMVFLPEIIGMTVKQDPKAVIEAKFNEFIIGNNIYNSKQLDFLLMLKKVFADRKYIELSDMARLPLSEEHPRDYFQLDELKSIVDKCNAIKVCC